MAQSKWRVTIEPEPGVFHGRDSDAEDPVLALEEARAQFLARYPDQARRLYVATFRVEPVHRTLEEMGAQAL